MYFVFQIGRPPIINILNCNCRNHFILVLIKGFRYLLCHLYPGFVFNVYFVNVSIKRNSQILIYVLDISKLFTRNSSGEESEPWKATGCEVYASNETHTTCHCYHLTNFAVIMDVHGVQVKNIIILKFYLSPVIIYFLKIQHIFMIYI